MKEKKLKKNAKKVKKRQYPSGKRGGETRAGGGRGKRIHLKFTEYYPDGRSE